MNTTITLYVKGDRAKAEEVARNRGVTATFQGVTSDGSTTVLVADDSQIDNVYLWYHAYGMQSTVADGALVQYNWAAGG